MGKSAGIAIALILVVAGVAAAFYLGTPADKKAAVTGPQIQFKETSHDFGQIIQGQKAETEFEFTNTGDAELIITKVRSTCGCTAALASADKILPGEKGSIKVSFNSAGRRGKNTKGIKVQTNVPGNETVELEIKTDILVELDFNPPRAYMGEFEFGKELTKEVELTNYTDQTINILEVSNSRDEIKAELEKKDIPPSGKIKIKITMTVPEGIDRNHISDKLQLKTDRKGSETISLPVYARNKDYKPARMPVQFKPGSIKGAPGQFRSAPGKGEKGGAPEGKPGMGMPGGKPDKESRDNAPSKGAPGGQPFKANPNR